MHSLERLTRMMRGLADPLASAYCHLYMAHRAALLHCKDIGKTHVPHVIRKKM